MPSLGYIKIASVSPPVTVANPKKNLNSALPFIKKAADDGCQIICLPELSLSSYTCGDLFGSSTLIDECEAALKNLMASFAESDAVIVAGLPLFGGFDLYNCAAVMQKGHLLGVVPKSYIPEYNEFYERRRFSSGLDCRAESVKLCGEDVPFGKLLFDLGEGAVMGIEICEDLWVPAAPSAEMALCGANIILNLSASDEVTTKDDYRTELVKQQSARCICAYAYTSAGVGESSTDLVFSGSCMIAENGGILKKSDRFKREGTYISACVDVQKLNALRRVSSFSDNAKEYVKKNDYRLVRAAVSPIDEKKTDRFYEAHPFVPDDENTKSKRCAEILEIQCAGLAKRMLHTGIKKLVIGISGGLDSTLALLVAHRTAKELSLPKENVICITMPGFGTTDMTYNNAVELIKCLGADFREINIKPASIQHMQDIGHNINIHDITYENTQARERTQILMDTANKEGALLVGTGDLSELALGWCTYNGDHMSMYAVNCGVPKTLVRHLVSFVADNSDERTSDVLKRVLDTPVSPELLPPDEQGKITQKTEEQLGPYEVHDLYLYHFIRFGFSPEKLLYIACRAFDGVYSKEQLSNWLKIFIKRFFSNQFKRSCIPDGPKVGSVSLSPRGDWRMPSDADSSIWADLI